MGYLQDKQVRHLTASYEFDMRERKEELAGEQLEERMEDLREALEEAKKDIPQAATLIAEYEEVLQSSVG
jgi:hypothetical protein